MSELLTVLNFKELGDERGKLVAIEGLRDIPFDIKRIFYIYGADSKTIRGCHANRESEFVFINVSGSCKIKATDGDNSIVVELNEPMKGIYMPKMIWKEMYDFSSDAVLLVLSNANYDSNEYIRDYEKYIEIIKDYRK